jgi:NurA domain
MRHKPPPISHAVVDYESHLSTKAMLDFLKVAQQMRGIGRSLSDESQASQRRSERAKELLEALAQSQDETVERILPQLAKVTFRVGEPVEDLVVDGKWGRTIAPIARNHTVFASDGSQINPSHHEIAYCYLINVGRVCLHYGTGLRPTLDSFPEVYYKEEDLYSSFQWGLSVEDWLTIRRARAEAVGLTNLVLKHQPPEGTPSVAMVDGSLVHWNVEQAYTPYHPELLQPLLEAWDGLQKAKVPLCGYISSSRSSDVVNFVRLQACPHETPDCERHCAQQPPRLTPCGNGLFPMTDCKLWEKILKPGERSAMWRSTARIVDLYGPHQVYFCYLHVGSEVARVEFPQWVALDPVLLDQTLGACLSQVERGYGYPVALAESHNQAVVRGGDRSRFFALLEDELIKAGLVDVRVSHKENRKRGSIA